MKKVSDQLQAARALIADGKGWIRHSMANAGPPSKQTQFCARGAIRRVVTGDAWKEDGPAEDLLREAANILYGHSIIELNDSVLPLDVEGGLPVVLRVYDAAISMALSDEAAE